MASQRVCITTLEYPPDVGGVGESVCRIAHMLRDSGYEVHVAVFRSRHRSGSGYRRSECATQIQDGVFVHRLQSAIRLDEPTLQDFLSEIYFQLKELHRQYSFDVFHAFFINETGFLTTLLGQESRVPVINSVRGSDLHKHVFDPKQHGQIVWTLENSTWVTFVSRELQQRACILAQSLHIKSSAFWNSIQPIDFGQLPTPALADTLQHHASNGIVIGATGKFRGKKGLEFLLDACAELSTEMKLTLLLVGDFADKERTYWEQELQNSGIADRVLITGLVERRQGLAYLPYMDIFAVPSLRGGCPNSLLEAMLAGCAIVGTTVDAIGEILEDGQNALVVNPGSSAELVTAIRTLAQSPELRQQLGQAARVKALHQLSSAVEQENWYKVYQQVLQEPIQFPQVAMVELHPFLMKRGTS
ncbi:MAG: glycosyltransferase family 4 protein [Cyanobacteria bacterium RU_5_0]|nr:glycosyltransferase family 4 protein [Cyanobacteria bacterium RU_5_0]